MFIPELLEYFKYKAKVGHCKETDFISDTFNSDRI